MSKCRLFLYMLILVLSFGCAGCGETVPDENADSTDEDGLKRTELQAKLEEQAREEETEDQPEDGLDYSWEEPRIEPTEEHDRQMLALLDEACGSEIYVYASVDMDQDGENEMIGVANDSGCFVWYCSSDLKSCYEVMQMSWHDDCTIKQIEHDEEIHVVVDGYNWMGTGKSYSILALHDGAIEVLVDDNYGYVYMNEEHDIILDIETYDGIYEKTDDIWIMHTWKDTYLYYEDGKYKEYGALRISEEEFLKYDNAQELLDEIEKENQGEDVVEIRHSYFIRENGIVHIQCEVEEYDAEYNNESITYFHYTLRENGNRLDGELILNYGIMGSSFSLLDEVTYP